MKLVKQHQFICLALSILTFHTTWCSNNKLRGFLVKPGRHVTAGGTEITRVSEPGLTMLRCAALCSREDCGVFQFNSVTKLCITLKQRLYQLQLTSDLHWDLGYTQVSEVTFGDWTLVFRLQKETSVPAYETWIQDGRHDDKPLASSLPLSCVRVFDYASCNQHFRSHILDNWSGITDPRHLLSLLTSWLSTSSLPRNLTTVT
ncbi:hypothetical protein ElyMa_002720900 [Elysia marginata]|uniref:Apple domain-containing protein n=1 Tax=Elysia marginata TaxID=1093978 RepID=A0AAV4HH86_9GAST|nr:hypothetical protein ElyMa_002720900 [Elysia marginata]